MIGLQLLAAAASQQMATNAILANNLQSMKYKFNQGDIVKCTDGSKGTIKDRNFQMERTLPEKTKSEIAMYKINGEWYKEEELTLDEK